MRNKKNKKKGKVRITYGRKIKFNWNVIEEKNVGLSITRDLCYIDNNGYLRWNAGDRLCHRDIAYHYIYQKGNYEKPFGEYDIHHKNKNKFDNRPENLRILTREDHDIVHGKKIKENGKIYIRIAKINRNCVNTDKAVLIGGKHGNWYPKSLLIETNGYVYAAEWFLKQKN